MTNHNPSLTNEQIKQLLESNFGPIYSIETPYNNLYQRNIEFMDVRHAQKGRQAIGLSAKIPTISEVRPLHTLRQIESRLFCVSVKLDSWAQEGARCPHCSWTKSKVC